MFGHLNIMTLLSLDLVSLLLSAASDHAFPEYGTKVLKFFNKLFQLGAVAYFSSCLSISFCVVLAEKNPNDPSYAGLCGSLNRLALIDTTAMSHWLSTMILGPSASTPNEDSASDDETLLTGCKTHENRLLLQSLTSYIVKENSHIGEEVASAILQALLPMGSQILSPLSEGIGFTELMVVMATLAGAGSGSGHASLVKAAAGWLELCKDHLLQKNVLEKLQESAATGKVRERIFTPPCVCIFISASCYAGVCVLPVFLHSGYSVCTEEDIIQQVSLSLHSEFSPLPFLCFRAGAESPSVLDADVHVRHYSLSMIAITFISIFRSGC
jgi:E3 ubiquitin-protein ligase UBR4